MGLYEKIINSFKNVTNIKERLKEDLATNESVSSALAAELTLISTLLIAIILLRRISILLTIILVLAIGLFLVTNMPLIPKLKREQSDSLDKMAFYAILTLGILITVIYWGTRHV
ncbi:energy-converting hydrogenase B subunit G EhbG [Methanobrevibacter sp. TMH8]|uniref:energy-converting hydrogenase B subunit G EhbG n=1 Tax=Methanobrevibacter sp. TMH8 TaxID=2848611 RepID=UPI001CCE14AB|nr:energy-converting hydrogenase B subunit G EhbG [Methanobrevibacter sp. TMH8]